MESLKPKVLVTFGIIDEVFNKLKEKVDVVLYWNTDVETTNLPRYIFPIINTYIIIISKYPRPSVCHRLFVCPPSPDPIPHNQGT